MLRQVRSKSEGVIGLVPWLVFSNQPTSLVLPLAPSPSCLAPSEHPDQPQCSPRVREKTSCAKPKKSGLQSSLTPVLWQIADQRSAEIETPGQFENELKYAEMGFVGVGQLIKKAHVFAYALSRWHITSWHRSVHEHSTHLLCSDRHLSWDCRVNGGGVDQQRSLLHFSEEGKTEEISSSCTLETKRSVVPSAPVCTVNFFFS